MPVWVTVSFSVWYLRNVCFVVTFIECFKWLVGQKNSVCVCLRMCVYAHCNCYFALIFEWFLAWCSVELLMSYCKYMYRMFHVTDGLVSYMKHLIHFTIRDQQEGKFLFTETIKLYFCHSFPFKCCGLRTLSLWLCPFQWLTPLPVLMQKSLYWAFLFFSW